MMLYPFISFDGISFFDFLNKVAVPVLIVRQPNECHAKVWFAITWLLNGFRVACTDTITRLYMRQPPTANSQFSIHL